MSINNVKLTCKYGLCLSCGICESVCPHGAVEIINDRPEVSKKCTECGICKKYCPGLYSQDARGTTDVHDTICGNIIESYVGRIRDLSVLRQSVSGGIASAIIIELLKQGIYDYAMGVGRPDFGNLKMEIFNGEQFDNRLQKSVYTMPDYHEVIDFITANVSKKIIIVGVGCIVNSIKNIIESKGLPKENYLFLGLFCGGTLDKEIEKYLKNYLGKGEIIEFDYREKTNGWPGDIRFYCKNRSISLPKEERQKIVKYFTRKRCLYCGNKLNTGADISIGDNYTGLHSDKLGSNTIVIRTKKGKEMLDIVKDNISIYSIDPKQIFISQNIDDIERHIEFGELIKNKGIQINNISVSHDRDWNRIKKAYKNEMRYIVFGRLYKYIPFIIEIVALIRGDTSIWNRLYIRLAKDE